MGEHAGFNALMNSIAGMLNDVPGVRLRAIFVPQVGENAGDVILATYENGRVITTPVDQAVEDFELYLQRTSKVTGSDRSVYVPLIGKFRTPIGFLQIAAAEPNKSLLRRATQLSELFVDHIAYEKTAGVFDVISRQVGFQENFERLDEIASTVCTVLTSALYCEAAYAWERVGPMLQSFGEAGLAMPVNEGLAGLAASRMKTIVAHNIQNREHNLAEWGRHIRHGQIIANMGVNDAIFIPVLKSNSTIAVFAVYFKRLGGATALDQVLSEYIVAHYASYFRLHDELKRLKNIELRLIEKSPYINSIISVLSDMHDLQNNIRGVEASLLLKDAAPSVKIKRALEDTSVALELLNRRREWMNIPVAGVSGDLAILKTGSKFERLNVSSLVDDAYQTFSSELKNAKINFSNEVDSRLRVRGNRNVLQRAIENLISNSARVLSIRPGSRKIWARTHQLENGGIAIAIEDNGGGIAPEDEKHMFEMLYTTWGQKGMGLGLTIVQSAASLHEGAVKYYNRFGHGVEFRIELPRTRLLG